MNLFNDDSTQLHSSEDTKITFKKMKKTKKKTENGTVDTWKSQVNILSNLHLLIKYYWENKYHLLYLLTIHIFHLYSKPVRKLSVQWSSDLQQEQ